MVRVLLCLIVVELIMLRLILTVLFLLVDRVLALLRLVVLKMCPKSLDMGLVLFERHALRVCDTA